MNPSKPLGLCVIYENVARLANLGRPWKGCSTFAHNHPSGLAEPSRADELLTRTLREALALVDVRVLDHVIVAGTSSASFAERGLL